MRPGPPAFFVSGGTDTCSFQTIPAGGSCSVPVVFNPFTPEITSIGNTYYSGTMVFASGLAAVSLSGYGESSQLGTPGQATAQISGTEQQTLNCHSVPNGEDCVPVTYDQGIVGFVIVAEDQNGHFITDQVFNVNYAAFDDPLSIATRLADAVNQSSTALVTATSNGDGSVTVASKTSGVPTNYSIDGLAYSTGGYPNDQTYNPASFSISLPSTLSGGTDPQP